MASTSTDTYATPGINVRWFSESDKLPGQPARWGFLLTLSTGQNQYEVHQFWLNQPDGTILHRGTNSASYQNPPAFKTIIDSSNIDSQSVAYAGRSGSAISTTQPTNGAQTWYNTGTRL